jgi:hypothetical protein
MPTGRSKDLNLLIRRYSTHVHDRLAQVRASIVAIWLLTAERVRRYRLPGCPGRTGVFACCAAVPGRSARVLGPGGVAPVPKRGSGSAGGPFRLSRPSAARLRLSGLRNPFWPALAPRLAPFADRQCKLPGQRRAYG